MLIGLICGFILGVEAKTSKVYCENGYDTKDFNSDTYDRGEGGIRKDFAYKYEHTIHQAENLLPETSIQKCDKKMTACEMGYNVKVIVNWNYDDGDRFSSKINKERVDKMGKKIAQAMEKVGWEAYNKSFKENCKVVEFD